MELSQCRTDQLQKWCTAAFTSSHKNVLPLKVSLNGPKMWKSDMPKYSSSLHRFQRNNKKHNILPLEGRVSAGKIFPWQPDTTKYSNPYGMKNKPSFSFGKQKTLMLPCSFNKPETLTNLPNVRLAKRNELTLRSGSFKKMKSFVHHHKTLDGASQPCRTEDGMPWQMGQNYSTAKIYYLLVLRSQR